MTEYSLRFARVASLAGMALLGAATQSLAGQITFENTCVFSVHVPGMFGGTDIDYRVQKGTIFNENEDHKFCGSAISPTPFGESSVDKCVAANGGKIVWVSGLDDFSHSDCQVSDASRVETAFNEQDFAPWIGAGPSSLHGQAFLKTVGGDVKTCAGEMVLIMPANPYFDELIEKWKSGATGNASPKALALIRKSICDAQGNFSFKSLPPQKWYVLSSVTWGVPHIEQPGDRPGPLTSLLLGIPPPPATDEQGGDLLQEVTLLPGDNEAYLTDRDRR